MFCFKSFSNRGSMTRHLRDQHLQPGATVTCDICGKVCKNRNCLITHRSVAHSGRRRPRAPPPQMQSWAAHDKSLMDMLYHQQQQLQQEVPTDQA
ncbi:Broad-complex core protein-like 10 [Homarus americanus]|uniref:Broad-complex core protein-like 10 n=1 Tax=Homarus americanus TaxID=6706 RepID=A0A8J5KAE8_HOMAM|nr:Broad-complex core protein-like 10 [Homarus americanus]